MDISDSTDSLKSDSLSNHTSQKAKFPIECRVKPSLWWLVLLGTLESLGEFFGPFFIYNSAPEPKQSILPIGMLCWTASLAFAFSALRMAFDLKFGVIRADETGLSWRRPFGKLKSVRWEEITDYYRGLSTNRVIVTPVGNLELITAFDGIDRIAGIVIEKTPHINNLGWELKKTRSKENWSRTFIPSSGEEKYVAPIMAGLLVLLLLTLTLPFITIRNWTQVSLGFWLDTFPLILGLVFGGTLIGGFVWSFKDIWREQQFASKHRDEKLMLDAKGLVFTSLDRHFEAKWQEIEKISLLPKVDGITPVQVETTSENFIIWNIAERSLWRRIELILDQYAAHARDANKAKEERLLLLGNDLEGERGAWSGGAIGVGSRRWSFRTRGTRFALQAASFVLLFMPVFYPLNAYNTKEDQPMIISWPLLTGLYALCGLVIAAGWLWYYRAETLADEQGLFIRSPFHRTFRVFWKDIEGIGTDPWGQFVGAGKRKFYFARVFQPVRVEELRAYIEQHMEKG